MGPAERPQELLSQALVAVAAKADVILTVCCWSSNGVCGVWWRGPLAQVAVPGLALCCAPAVEASVEEELSPRAGPEAATAVVPGTAAARACARSARPWRRVRTLCTVRGRGSACCACCACCAWCAWCACSYAAWW